MCFPQGRDFNLAGTGRYRRPETYYAIVMITFRDVVISFYMLHRLHLYSNQRPDGTAVGALAQNGITANHPPRGWPDTASGHFNLHIIFGMRMIVCLAGMGEFLWMYRPCETPSLRYTVKPVGTLLLLPEPGCCLPRSVYVQGVKCYRHIFNAGRPLR